MNLVHHVHPPEEMDAPAWDVDRLLAHLAGMHDMVLVSRSVQSLAAIHAAEHPEQAGIKHDPEPDKETRP